MHSTVCYTSIKNNFFWNALSSSLEIKPNLLPWACKGPPWPRLAALSEGNLLLLTMLSHKPSSGSPTVSLCHSPRGPVLLPAPQCPSSPTRLQGKLQLSRETSSRNPVPGSLLSPFFSFAALVICLCRFVYCLSPSMKLGTGPALFPNLAAAHSSKSRIWTVLKTLCGTKMGPLAIYL